MLLASLQRFDAAVDDDGELGKVALQVIHPFVVERRDLPVLLGREPLQPGLARVHDKHLGTARRHSAHKIQQLRIALLMVDADPVLHGNGHFTGVTHGRHTVAHQCGLGHEAGAKAPVLHTVRGAAAIQIDLVVAPLLTHRRAGGEIRRCRATQLQSHGVLLVVKAQVSFDIPMEQRAGGHHLGIDPRVAREGAPEASAVPVGPVHAGRGTKAPRAVPRVGVRAVSIQICHQMPPLRG